MTRAWAQIGLAFIVVITLSFLVKAGLFSALV